MKLSARDRAILTQLDCGEAAGLDLVHAGLARRGSVYVVLTQLEDRGFVRRREESDASSGLPRHWFSITEGGRAALGASPCVPTAQVKATWWRTLIGRLRRAP